MRGKKTKYLFNKCAGEDTKSIHGLSDSELIVF
jgi:hypothetical protein